MKINTTLSLFTAGVLLSASVFAMAHAGGGMAEYDTDGNGTVTAEEVLAGKTADFNAANTNANDDLTLAEFAGLENIIQTRHVNAAFAKINTDTSSDITLAEFTATATGTAATYLTNVFNLADKDANAVLSVAEFTDLQSKGSNSGMWEFARLDTDANKLVSLAEFTAVPATPTAPANPGMGGGKGGKGGKR
jgi:Ca2+-binding EF-hand superfamily protein